MLTPAEQEALWLSVTVSGTAVISVLPLTIVIAWILVRCRFPGRLVLDSMVHLPLVLPPVVIGYLLLVLLGTQGIIGSWLLDIFDIRLIFTWQGAAVSTAVVAFPLMVRSIRLSLEAIDPNLEIIARTLGASRLDALCTITLPLMIPGILAGVSIGFSSGLGAFGAVITFVSNIPGETRTIPLAIYTALQIPGGEMAAARLTLLSVSLAIITLGLSEWLNRVTRQWVGQPC